LKVADDIVEAEGQMAGDVFKEGPFGPDFSDDACNIGPEVAGIIFALAIAREGEGLAGITGSDDMNAAAPRSAIKGFEIVPDRSRSQGRVCHPCHENGRRETVSLDMTYSPISGFSEAKAKIKSSDTGAKADAAKVVMSDGGMKSHKNASWKEMRSSRSREVLKASIKAVGLRFCHLHHDLTDSN
jgi:hypothetical protein